jgi:hypothetical protein
MYQSVNDVYKEIFGEDQSREGEALERIANLVFSILKNEKSKWDVSVSGAYSGQSYQVDGVLEKCEESIECKDYSQRGDKVGRPDVQSYEGALIDQSFKKGNFVSSTGYTNRAEKYEQGLTKNPRAIPIECYEIRNAVEKDLEGRILTIIVNIHAIYPDFSNAKIKPILTKKGMNDLIASGISEGTAVSGICDRICDNQGNTIRTISELSIDWNKYVYNELDKMYFTFYHSPFIGYIYLNNCLVELKALEVNVPIVRIEDSLEIKASEAALYVKNSSGSINSILSIEDLKDQYAKMGGLESQRAKGKENEQ